MKPIKKFKKLLEIEKNNPDNKKLFSKPILGS